MSRRLIHVAALVGVLVANECAVARAQTLSPGAAPVVTLSDDHKPAQGPFDTPAAFSTFQPALPPDAPAELADLDPLQPVTDLASALERAYWASPQLLAERARLRGTDFGVPQARGQYGPRLQYALSHGYQRDTFEQPLGPALAREGWSSTASSILSQPLFTFGRFRANEDAARANVAFGREVLRAVEQQALFNAINAYTLVIRDRNGVRIANDNLDLLSREFSDTQARLRARELTITDAQQVQTRVELARAQLLVAQGAASSSEALFLRFVGAVPGILSVPNPLSMPVDSLEEAYEFADAHNPVVASAYARERLSRAELAGARAELLPRVDLSGSALYGPQTPYSNAPRQIELRAGVTISGTFNSGISRARIGENRAVNDADWRLIDAALRENRAELASAWYDWQTQERALVHLESAVASARQAVDGALLQERAGLRTTLDVLELARDLLQARSNVNAASAGSFTAQARVLAALGALGHEDLLERSPHYNPHDHYDQVDGQADIPILTNLVRTLDSLATPRASDRLTRDPAARVALVGAPSEVPREYSPY